LLKQCPYFFMTIQATTTILKKEDINKFVYLITRN